METEEFENAIIVDIQIVPINYRYYIAVNYMYGCLINCRAETIKEAVNLYEEQLHR